MESEELWIAVTGLRRFEPEATHVSVPIGQLEDDGVSLIGIGLYGEALSYQGAPIDVLTDALDEPDDLRAAVDELVRLGYVVAVTPPNN